MKYSLVLVLILVAVWAMWSGHFDKPFLLALGGISILLTWIVCWRMRILDQETVPVHLLIGILPFLVYLAREIVVSNIAVARIILSPRMELHRNMYEVDAKQKTAMGNVILANSITLTPGTVSVSMTGDQIKVHALSFDGIEEDLSGEMEKKIAKMEGQ